MTLDEFNKKVIIPMTISHIERGKLDNAIFDPDVQDIEFSPEVRAAMDARKAILAKRA